MNIDIKQMTPQQLAKIVAPYLGATCYVGDQRAVALLTLSYSNELHINLYGFCSMPIGGATLILRPLHKIGDEDAIEAIKIAKMLVLDDGWIIGEDSDINSIKAGIIEYDRLEGFFRSNVTEFLRSQGYDIKHHLLGNKTLQEVGLATYE